MRVEPDEKTARQAKLSKALSSAYLNHQISQIEEKVRTVSLDPTSDAIAKRNGIKAAHVDEREFPALGVEPLKVKVTSKNGNTDPSAKAYKEKEGVTARIDESEGESDEMVFGDTRERREGRDSARGRGGRRGRGDGRGRGDRSRGHHGRENGHHHHHHDEREDGFDIDLGESKSWRVVVLDTSALLWAPQGVRRLVRQGWEVIVPIEALRTLDLLKSGSSPSARAARGATRFIEHSSRHFKHIPDHIDMEGDSHPKGRGLRMQHDAEIRSPDSVSSLPIPNIDGDVLPKWVENILGCAAYFMSLAAAVEHSDKESVSSFVGTGATLCVSNPPLSVETEEGFTGNIGQRSEGYTISQEAERFEIPIEVLRDEEDEIEQERIGKKAHRSRTRAINGRARGGGRAGPRGDDSPEEQPEVKILLRRPVDEKAGSVTVPAPHVSSPSTVNRSPLPALSQVKEPASSGLPHESDQEVPHSPGQDHRGPSFPPPPPLPFAHGPPPPFDHHGHPFDHHGPPFGPPPFGSRGPPFGPHDHRRGPHGRGPRPPFPPPPPLFHAHPPPFDHPPPPPGPPPFGRHPPRGFGFDPRRRAYDDSSESSEDDRSHGHSHRSHGHHRGQAHRGRGSGHRGDHSRGRGGRGRGRGNHRAGGTAPGEFVLLQRPGPAPQEERMGGPGSGPKVVLLQRPK